MSTICGNNGRNIKILNEFCQINIISNSKVLLPLNRSTNRFYEWEIYFIHKLGPEDKMVEEGKIDGLELLIDHVEDQRAKLKRGFGRNRSML